MRIAHDGEGFVRVQNLNNVGRNEAIERAVGQWNERRRIGLYDNRAIRPWPQSLPCEPHHGRAEIKADVPALLRNMIAQEPGGQSSGAAAKFANGVGAAKRTMANQGVDRSIAEDGPPVFNTPQTVVKGFYVSV